jgi:hypothetical protein
MQASSGTPEARNYYAEAYDRLMPKRCPKSRGIVPETLGEVYRLAMMDMPKAVRCLAPEATVKVLNEC